MRMLSVDIVKKKCFSMSLLGAKPINIRKNVCLFPVKVQKKPLQEKINKLRISYHKLRVETGRQLERFSIAFTANDKRQAEISRLPKSREIYFVSAYILPVSHSYGASTKNREIS